MSNEYASDDSRDFGFIFNANARDERQNNREENGWNSIHFSVLYFIKKIYIYFMHNPKHTVVCESAAEVRASYFAAAYNNYALI